MRFLLRIKHWQLFLMTWGVPIMMNFFTATNPNLLFKLFPVMMLFFIVGIFGWIWAIATELHGKLPAHVKLNVGRFKILFSIPILYMFAIIVYMVYAFSTSSSTEVDSIAGVIVGFVIVLHLFSIVCIIIGLRFAAKTMRSVELGRMARFGDYVGEFFLMWFSIIGFWVLQPRLNKLTEELHNVQ
jgi:hypothetical protein